MLHEPGTESDNIVSQKAEYTQRFLFYSFRDTKKHSQFIVWRGEDSRRLVSVSMPGHLFHWCHKMSGQQWPDDTWTLTVNIVTQTSTSCFIALTTGHCDSSYFSKQWRNILQKLQRTEAPGLKWIETAPNCPVALSARWPDPSSVLIFGLNQKTLISRRFFVDKEAQ